jgi:CBS domain
MSAPVVRVVEATEAAEIAALLAQYRIKRVPVVRDGRLVGIVSRADLLRAVAGAEEPAHAASTHRVGGGLFADAIAALDRRFFGQGGEQPGVGQAAARPEGGFNVGDFRSLMDDFAHRKAAAADAVQREAAVDRRNKVAELIDEHVRDESWQKLRHQAREAAERGEKEFLLLRFPSDLCVDRGRAINAAASDWPTSLRGEPAEIYLRWASELQPRGFHLIARVLDFPGGMPGDVGLFLGWGE